MAEVAGQIGDGVKTVGGSALGGTGDNPLRPTVEADTVCGRHPEVVGDHEAGKGLEQIGDDVATSRLDDPVQG